MRNAHLGWALLGGLVLLSGWGGYSVWRKMTGTPPRVCRLADGTIAALGADTRLIAVARFPRRRELSLDGEALLEVQAGQEPLTIRTHLMHLLVRGASTVAITARSREGGEQVEVLNGEVIASKNYPSPDRVPDDLQGGEMSMVNQSIDLMEKEQLDPPELARLRERVTELNSALH